MANPHLAQGTLVREDGVIRLSEAGIFVSDGIMSDLLRV
jgi:oxygen-independent coproporphyrinogen-3 oxidase